MLWQCCTCYKQFKPRKRQNKEFSFCSRTCFKERKKIKKTCLGCHNDIEITVVNAKHKDLCSKCYQREYKKLHPEKVEKERLRQLHKTRNRKGLSLDHDFLIARPGTGHLTKSGYKVIYKPLHKNVKDKNGAIFEHSFVMSEHLGRALFKGECVHHKNGIRHDNRIENLELWNKNQPPGQRVEDKIKFYKEFLEQYGYEVTKR